MQIAQLRITPPANFDPTNPVLDILDYENFLGLFFSRAIVFAIVLGGLFFLGKLINAGYIYLTSIGDPGKIQSATNEITNAGIGLTLLISVFFVMQIIETILGINILGIS